MKLSPGLKMKRVSFIYHLAGLKAAMQNMRDIAARAFAAVSNSWIEEREAIENFLNIRQYFSMGNSLIYFSCISLIVYERNCLYNHDNKKL